MSEATSEKASEKASEKGAENIRVVENATCTFCGCVCDDMVLTVDLDTGKITKAKNAPRTRASWARPGSWSTPRRTAPSPSSTGRRWPSKRRWKRRRRSSRTRVCR
jgi:hypothetical protein